MNTAMDLFGETPRVYRGGYAADPGSGPAGETCKSCRYCFRQCGTARTYYKCVAGRVTRGPATDIRLSAPACRKWEAQE